MTSEIPNSSPEEAAGCQTVPGPNHINVALVGNPNCGKSTIFNHLTGARQQVGNYPGVTVDRTEGLCFYHDLELHLIDLPGSYSLAAYSKDEQVTRQYLLEEKFSNLERAPIVVNVLDSSNFERNLYLSLQLRELGMPMVLVMNMIDIAVHRGLIFNRDRIAEYFDAPVVEAVGANGQGLEKILSAIETVARQVDEGKNFARKADWITYSPEIEAAIARLVPVLKHSENLRLETAFKTRDEEDAWFRWNAVKLIEHDREILGFWAGREVREAAESAWETLGTGRDSSEVQIASGRYAVISRIRPQIMAESPIPHPNYTRRLDRVFLHRFWGLPIFFLMMLLVFLLTFFVGKTPQLWIQAGFQKLSAEISSFWPAGTESLLKSLLVDGVIGGVGGVVVFLPSILILFLAISFLEDSGYMARAAFLMDRFMAKIGLHGKSFIPMIVGFGCSVPGIMATRVLENRKERLATMFVVPLMSCGARLPIFILMISTFVVGAWYQGLAMFAIYLIGILLGIGIAKLLRGTILRDEPLPFIMELPPYHVPTLRTVGLHALERGWQYLKKAGTVILGISIVLWALTTFPRLPESQLAQLDAECTSAEEIEENALEFSYAGQLGKWLEPALRPMGFDWKLGTSLIGAFAAKEVFVAHLGIIYRVGEADAKSATLQNAVRKNYSPLVGFCIMLFCLIGSPCVATVAVMARESESWRWALAQWGSLTLLAWCLTTLVYQIGTHVFGL